VFFAAALACAAAVSRVKRQESANADGQKAIQEVCAGKAALEWFRLSPNDDNCKKVWQCTDRGLEGIKCPTGLVFDLIKQTCDWKSVVTNCELTQRPRRPLPKYITNEPICTTHDLIACGDDTCLVKESFCDGKLDCPDGSDENLCDMENDPNRAPKCDPTTCVLPECFCSETGTVVPGDLDTGDPAVPPTNVPQMIMITLNGAINNNNIQLFDDLFRPDLLNPNGCPIKGTFFVSHKYTNYTAVQSLHSRGHEIGVFSISQNENPNYWNNATQDEWKQEMAGQRQIVERFAGITDQSVVGIRTPYLRVGGNNQFQMMEEQRFLYDSTLTAPLSDIPIWPYTMLNQMPHVCHGNAQKCPTRGFPVWEMVMNELDPRDDPLLEDTVPGCAQVDSCSNIRDGDQFINFLNNNFNRHYLTNRAPLSLNFHSAWLKKQDYLDSLIYWINDLKKEQDVYFVTMTQVIQWMQYPKTVTETVDFEPWLAKCDAPLPFPCARPGGNNCALHAVGVQGTFNMQTCQRCPSSFPWLNDTIGEA